MVLLSLVILCGTSILARSCVVLSMLLCASCVVLAILGDLVWYFYSRRYVKHSKKWSFVYVCPYKIILETHGVVCMKFTSRLETSTLVVHVENLKKCATVNKNDIPKGELKFQDFLKILLLLVGLIL